jgi:hypothetical protein
VRSGETPCLAGAARETVFCAPNVPELGVRVTTDVPATSPTGALGVSVGAQTPFCMAWSGGHGAHTPFVMTWSGGHGAHTPFVMT